MPATKTAVSNSKFYDYDIESQADPAQNELSQLTVNCLPGENEAVRVESVLSYHPFSFGQSHGLIGVLIVTNFRISFRSLGDTKNGRFAHKLLNDGDIALANIDKIILLSANGRKTQLLPLMNIEPPVEDVEIHCKDLRLQIFCFKLAKFADSKRALLALISYAFPTQVEQLFAFQLDKSFVQENEEVDSVPDFMGRDDWQQEINKQEADQFSVTDINMEFSVCRSLPPFSAVVKNVNVSEYVTEDQRFPVWSCSHTNSRSKSKASLVRVPYTVDPGKRTFLEHNIKCRIGEPLSKKEVHDLTELLPSARELQASFDKLRLLLMPTSAREYEAAEVGWYSALENTRWPDVVLRCLSLASDIAIDLHQGTSILLAERDHRDWAPLVSCLVQLMLEPRWRTLMGLQELIQREWVACGHNFTTRLGLLHPTDNTNGQLTEMFPSSFEFSETYLVTLWDTACLALFRTFIFSSAEDVYRYCKSPRGRPPPALPSAWLWSLQFSKDRVALFRNPLYSLNANDKFVKSTSNIEQQADGTLLQSWHAGHITLWSAFFLRWLTPLHFPGGGSGVRHYTRTMLADDIIAMLDGDAPSRPSSASYASSSSLLKSEEETDSGRQDNQRSSQMSTDSASRTWPLSMPWAFPFVTGNEHAAEELTIALSLAHHARFDTTEPLDEDNE